MPASTNDTGGGLLPTRLIRGYEDFLKGRFRREQDRYGELGREGQKPETLLIGCADSRVSPEVIFDAGPGEIFVVRNIAALVPPYMPDVNLHGTSSCIEFAVLNLEVKHIVIMGHAGCGGVRAFVDAAADPKHALPRPDDFIGPWMSLIKPAAETLGPPQGSLDEYARKLGEAAVIHTLANLRTFPYVREREASGKLALHGAIFGTADGRLLALDEKQGVFLPVGGAVHAEAFAAPRF
ncbi:MAG: carbonic anhydrase [Beijerinckiaceae bacterium]|nr:MAG: carbonic anhydrase [Beijerinckiaceae bacterium]